MLTDYVGMSECVVRSFFQIWNEEMKMFRSVGWVIHLAFRRLSFRVVFARERSAETWRYSIEIEGEC